MRWLSFYISVLFALFADSSNDYADGWRSIIPFAVATGGLFLAGIHRRHEPSSQDASQSAAGAPGVAETSIARWSRA
ncbi:hypothetical protein MU0083_001752 [[Mycobacterium] kokjensenii]|uniref:Uncharacterized protein n=1 Tax=[Mycobacterium] kokjensenii TaxID=3064287 RepID=A0ABN9N292_9MYCO|nr:hypothetical protein [Mycolicibacter sp. MU0083]CAJ1497741.1 hypothetical protein MU0083_001752 [Mycolicibacter sp. MU0083]